MAATAMDLPLLTAAKTAATPVKNEDAKGEKTEKSEEAKISPEAWHNCSTTLWMLLCFFLLVLDKLNLFGKQERTWQVKADAEPGPTAKKRKSEWTAALKKLPGDTTLVQDC